MKLSFRIVTFFALLLIGSFTAISSKAALGVSTERVVEITEASIQKLRTSQMEDGSWTEPIMSSSIVNNGYIILLYEYLGIVDSKKNKIEELMRYIWSQQSSTGGFGGYLGGKDRLGLGTLAYLSAKIAGESENSGRMRRLEAAINRDGGLKKADYLVQPYLLVFNLDKRTNCVPDFLLKAMMRADSRLPWAKVMVYPFLYLMGKGYTHTLSDDKYPTRLGKIHRGCPVNFPHPFRKKIGDEHFQKWAEGHLSPDGTLFDYTPTTIPTLMALSRHGNKYENVIRKGLKTLEDFQIPTPEGLFQSPGEGSVGETGVLISMLLDLGISPSDPVVSNAVQFLKTHRHESTGAFGFSKNNVHFADADDTASNVRVLRKYQDLANDHSDDEKLESAMLWVLDSQNRDGGFGTWEKNRTPILQGMMRRVMKTDIILSESVVEHTARIAVGLSLYRNKSEKFEESYQKAIKWLLKHQNEDGSFESTWTVGYAFGTGSVLEAYATDIGNPEINTAAEKSLRYVLSLQHDDGGWGEDVSSYEQGRSVPLSYSSPAQTGFVVAQLLYYLRESQYKHWDWLEPYLERAVTFMISTRKNDGEWHDPTWTGVTFPKLEYVKYKNIHEIVPAFAIGFFGRSQSEARRVLTINQGAK